MRIRHRLRGVGSKISLISISRETLALMFRAKKRHGDAIVVDMHRWDGNGRGN